VYEQIAALSETQVISTDLAAVRVPDDDVGLYNVTGEGWYAINGEDKAVLGPFESLGECDLAIRDRVSLVALPELVQFQCPASLKLDFVLND